MYAGKLTRYKTSPINTALLPGSCVLNLSNITYLQHVNTRDKVNNLMKPSFYIVEMIFVCSAVMLNFISKTMQSLQTVRCIHC